MSGFNKPTLIVLVMSLLCLGGALATTKAIDGAKKCLLMNNQQ